MGLRSRIQVVGLVFMLAACSLPNLNPFSSPEKAPIGPPHPTDIVTGKVGEWTDIFYQWWWMGLVLLLFFPQLHQPILTFWTAIFRTVTIPFEFATLKWRAYRDSR